MITLVSSQKSLTPNIFTGSVALLFLYLYQIVTWYLYTIFHKFIGPRVEYRSRSKISENDLLGYFSVNTIYGKAKVNKCRFFDFHIFQFDYVITFYGTIGKVQILSEFGLQDPFN